MSKRKHISQNEAYRMKRELAKASNHIAHLTSPFSGFRIGECLLSQSDELSRLRGKIEFSSTLRRLVVTRISGNLCNFYSLEPLA